LQLFARAQHGVGGLYACCEGFARVAPRLQPFSKQAALQRDQMLGNIKMFVLNITSECI
jgi:hypothetical protein